MATEDLKQAILSRLDKVVGPDSQGQYMALCPLHDDHRQSLSVNLEKGVYYCFGCFSSGHITRLAQVLGIAVNGVKETPMGNRIKTEQEAMELLYQRGLSDDTIRHFRIGVDLQSQAWRYPVVYQGKIKGWRFKAFPGERDNKYWWKPGGGRFPLYGLDDVQGKAEVWLVEGEPDLWIMHQAGLPAITFPSGAGITPKGAVELLREVGISCLNMCYDLDTAGGEGAQKVAQKLIGEGFKVAIRKLPPLQPGHDDINDLYLELNRDNDRFRQKVEGLGEEKITKPEERAPREGRKGKQADYLACFDGLIDIVDKDGETLYLLREGEGLKVSGSYNRDGKTFYPPPKDKLPWLLPRFSEVAKAYREDDPQALLQDLEDHHKRYSLLPSPDYYLLLAIWDFHTYLTEPFDHSPVLYFLATPERGKTKTGKAITFVAYRGIHTETLREPNLFRQAEDMGATLFLDVFDFWKKVKRNGSEDIILHRFEKGEKVPRVIYPERGAFRDTRYFKVFSPTLIATNEAVPNVLQGRCLCIGMPEANRNFPEPRDDKSLPLRERLVAWRARMMGSPLPEVGEFVVGRLHDITLPLRQIARAVSLEVGEVMDNLIMDFDRQRRADKASSEEAELLQAIIDSEELVQGGRLSIGAITNKVNEDKNPHFWLSPEEVGRKLKPLGFTKDRLTGGKRAIRYDLEKIEELKHSFCIAENSEDACQKTVTTVIPSLPDRENQIWSEGSDGSDGFSTSVPMLTKQNNDNTPGLAPTSPTGPPPGAPPPPSAKPIRLYTDDGREALFPMEYQGEPIYVALDDDWAKKAPPGFPVYTLAEIETLKDKPEAMKQFVHEAKKQGGKVVGGGEVKNSGGDDLE